MKKSLIADPAPVAYWFSENNLVFNLKRIGLNMSSMGP